MNSQEKKYVYLFKEGNKDMRNLLGGKGANLAEMTNIGLPVPQGFTITTEACTRYYEDGEKISDDILNEIKKYLRKLEEITGKKFGDENDPLLVSVRSGARASMPGMMDTILNLGLNDKTVISMAKLTNNERFAYDSYRRFIQMFSDVVMQIEKSKFETILDEIKKENGAKYDTDLTADNLKEVVKRYKELYKKEMGKEFPQDPEEQLIESVKAVFRSWNNQRAIVYRRLNDIPGDWGTAVNVQQMVFGNMGETSGTGVAFTRNPATGEKKIFGEYLINAQGEDVVAGIRTPQPITKLQQDLPECYKEFMKIAQTLENHYKDMQDMEFTIQQGKLYFLQTRNGKRTANAALKVAVDMVNEGLITKEEALLKVEPKQLDQLLHPAFDEKEMKTAKVIAKGLPASPGAAYGKVYFTAEDVKAHKEKGEKVVLVRGETSPEDIEGMVAAEGILTVRGGMTSHAAVVARGMGKCCVAGCGDININEEAKYFTADGVKINEGDYISFDGTSGNVYGQKIKTVEPTISGNFGIFMGWADAVRKLKVRTNADTPKDARQAVKFGAEGIGLCRTEHMFFAEDRIAAVREMIVANNGEQRRKALAKILPMQKEDFIGIYEAMETRPVTIRLLDPPLHEFLPHEDDDIRELAGTMGLTFEELKSTVEGLKEFNPMMGHRGCRLAVSYPEIAEMQTRAIIEAAIDVKKRKGYNIVPEIMIPLVGEVKELKYVKDVIVKTADKVIKENGVKLKYLVGTMIEIPRAALTADEIAKEADFFSFGTNDLTQMTFGFSRDDAGKFLNDYYDKKIYEFDPFQKLDQVGVGKLVKMAAELGRSTRPDIHLGICGEHGGEPSSIEFCHNIGLDYVSCSPFRVPIARLAAAQAQVKNPR
ncbi:MAG TPA: pyruvate, phosphate dikinase [Clostridiaceae bacterium]|jgi:pyruvate,orthophosphate dikinase|nr:pyruvate, phosphate dikinase [Clostridiaceae bacterium]HBF77590.1 pyruvate, phosphate dikinase [Clostridiaceae bacterium]HBG37945.1 pyruvate, phosphate dikinase [Clostridiaceae bacterium]HBX48002.1 pyruvate, phosphate dikinase [Clostridiaceae bacterium]HCL51160.1 pyruvate, phosphate dikinase [Clostridiaceae bacterium]